MTKFYTYNIQLLPNAKGIKEVGVIGYKRLFRALKELNKNHLKERTLHEFHYPISSDIFIGPDQFYIKESYVYGYFIKYTKTDEVKNLNRRTTVFRNNGNSTTVSKDEGIPFVFDARRHYFCIEGSSVLNASMMVLALEKFLTEIAEKNFPDHELTVNSVSEPNSFESILETATGFKTVQLRATFENGHDDTQGVLKQLKDSKTKTLNVNASGGKGVMSKLPPFIEELARAAVVVGALSMTYYVSANTRRHTYDSKESPLTFSARRSSDDDETSFFARVHQKLLQHVDSAEAAAHKPVETDMSAEQKSL